MTYKTSLVFTLAQEGGYVDDPVDRGGATNRGITQGTYDQWRHSRGRPTAPVRNITEAEVEAIYAGYWLRARCDVLRDRVALAHFDAAVNHGTTMAAKLLQRAAGVADDGQIGPLTLAAVNAMPEDRVLGLMLMERRVYYDNIVDTHPEQVTFLPGWVKRLRHLAVAVWP